MSSERPGAPAPPADSDSTHYPELRQVLEPLRRELDGDGQLGLLSVTVLRRGSNGADAWADYDAVRHQVSLFLTRQLRPTDAVLRPAVSGNTIVIALGPPRTGRALGLEDLGSVRDRLQQALNSHLAGRLPHALVERFGACVGAALLRHEPDAAWERVVYRALEESIADALRRAPVEASPRVAELRRILDSSALTAVYQPLVDLGRRTVIGFEALARAAEPLASPELLFRAAHESGMLWAVERLCRRRALEDLPPMEQRQLLFLNLERESFEDPALLESGFASQLSQAGLEPRRVVLELTEHSCITDFVPFREVLRRCRDYGFRLAMDDVGAGYSGLQAIAEFEPDFLKLDRTLVRDVHLRPVKRELIATIRRFTESTGIVLVAEGVETSEELAALLDLGVGCAQGFLFSRPGSPPLAPDWLRLAVAAV